MSVQSIDEPSRLAYTMSANFRPSRSHDRQSLAQMDDAKARLDSLRAIQAEIESCSREKIPSRVKKQMEKTQKE